MESITIYVENKAQREVLYMLLKHLDFVTIPISQYQLKRIKPAKFNIFEVAGIWENRPITQSELRARAWKKN